MGLLERMQTILTGPARSGLNLPKVEGYSFRSPDSSGAMAQAILGDTLQTDEGPVSVGQALRVPPVSRAVDLYSAAFCQLDLSPDSGPSEDPDYKWLTHTEGPITPSHRNVSMMLDLFWHRFTLLAVARNEAGHVVNGIHVPKHMWDFDVDGSIRVDRPDTAGRAVKSVVSQDEILLIPSYKQMGFLEYAQDTVRQYLSICRTINDRADNPTPMVGVKIKDDFQPDDDERDQALDDWSKARKSKGGATAFIPGGIDIVTPGADKDDSSMLIQARQAIRLDAANFTNLPAEMLEGSSGSSGDYSNTLQNANEFLKLSVSLYSRAIEARLSQDDVTPEGVKITFNTGTFDSFTPAQGNVGTATARAENGDARNG